MSEKKKLSVANVLNAGVAKHSRHLVSNLGIALKVSRLYGCQHVNVTEAVENLGKVIQIFVESEGYLQLSRFEEFLLVNETRVRLDFGGVESYRYIVDLFSERNIGEMIFSAVPDAGELDRLIDLFNNHTMEGEEDPWGKFTRLAERANLANITFGQQRARKEAGEEVFDDSRVVAFRTFFKCCYAMRNALDSSREGKKANLKRLKRNIQAMVDLINTDEALLLSLVNIKDFASPEANHAVNTAVLSIALGNKLGMSKRLLGDLGMAALLHDMGKVRLPNDLSGDTALSSGRIEEYLQHVYYGPEQLLLQRVVNATVKSINVAFLHHHRYDGTGYPKLMQPKEQNLFTRIVAVANYYDNCSTGGGLHGPAENAEKILRHLMDGSGTEFDPLVVKAFINLLGLYPVGCMVQLDSGEIGTVVSPSTNPRYLGRPKVRLFSDAAGNSDDRVIDLLQRGPDDRFQHSILKLYQQQEVELNLEEYLAVV